MGFVGSYSLKGLIRRAVLLVALALVAVVSDPASAAPACRDLFATEGFAAAKTRRMDRLWEKITDQRRHLEAYHQTREAILTLIKHDLKSFDAGVKLVSDPHEALLAKILMIRDARHTLDISYFIFHYDRVSQTLLHEVREAVRRGVTVRILVDSLGSIDPAHFNLKSLIDFAQREGGPVHDGQGRVVGRATVEVKLFNPVSEAVNSVLYNWYRRLRNAFRPPGDKLHDIENSLTRRSHDKILLADGEYPDLAVAIIGGRNVAEAYYGLARDPTDQFNDLEVIVRNDPRSGSPREQMGRVLGRYFNALYYHLGNKHLARGLLGSFFGIFQKSMTKMDEAAAEVLALEPVQAKVAEMQRSDYLRSGFIDARMDLIHTIRNIVPRQGRPGPADSAVPVNRNSFDEVFWQEITQARKSIRIVSPYLLLSERENAFLVNWLKADPSRRVEVLMNSPLTTDKILVQAVVDMAQVPVFLNDPALRDQISVLQYGRSDAVETGGDRIYGKLHAKFAVIDDAKSIVTSYNWDPRSRNLNSELGFAITSPEFNAAVVRHFEELKSSSYEYGSAEWDALRSRPEIGRFRRFVVDHESLFYRFLLAMGIIDQM